MRCLKNSMELSVRGKRGGMEDRIGKRDAMSARDTNYFIGRVF